MKHMDLKQMELDTAAAKVDELTKQLESLWSDSPAAPLGSQAAAPARVSPRVLVPPWPPEKSASFGQEFRQACLLGQAVGCLRVSDKGSQWKWTFVRTLRRKGAFF